MHSFSSVQNLLKAFRKIKLEVLNMTFRNESMKSNIFTSLKKLTKENKSKIITCGVIECYAYNETGHYAKDCLVKKRSKLNQILKKSIYRVNKIIDRWD